MHIGFDAKRLYNNFTGLGNYSRTLVQNLYNDFPENKYSLYTTRIKQNKETNYFLENQDINTYLPNHYFKSYWRSFSIVQQLKENNTDIYHGLSHEIPFGLRKSGIRSVVTIHDLIFRIYPKTYNAVDRIIYNSKFKYSCKNADRIVSISNSTRNDIVTYYDIDPSKIDVIYQSCNPDFAIKKSDDERNKVKLQFNLPSEFILYVGSVIERKNLSTLIDIYSFLPSDLQLPLVVVGHGKEYMAKVKEKIASKGWNNKVIWLQGVKDNSDLQSIYQLASVFVYPSVYEGFGIPVIESILSKTPVITSNVSSLPEAAGPYSSLINPLNAEEIAVSVLKVLTDTEFRRETVSKSFEYVMENFNGKKVTQQLIQLYKNLL